MRHSHLFRYNDLTLKFTERRLSHASQSYQSSDQKTTENPISQLASSDQKRKKSRGNDYHHDPEGSQQVPQSILRKTENLNCKNFGARYDQGDNGEDKPFDLLPGSVYISVSAYDGVNKK